MPSAKKEWLFRVDAEPAMGSGHLMRCLALAQAWRNQGGHATFGMARSIPSLEERLTKEEMAMVRLQEQPGTPEDAQSTVSLARSKEAGVVIVDGYQFGGDYQRRIKDAGIPVMFFDDYGHATRYTADWVLNQNVGADPAFYQDRSEDTRLLLGSRYILLRQEFLRSNAKPAASPSRASRILVTLGGCDPDNVTARVIQALDKLHPADLDVKIVLGAGNRYRDEISRLMKSSPVRMQLETNVTDMSPLMTWADMAITAGGTTCWELAYLGVPFLVVIIAENQRASAVKLEDLGVAMNLGWHETLSSERLTKSVGDLMQAAEQRSTMASRGRQAVDGQGAERVIMQLRRQPIRIRGVQPSDCRMIWEWANEPELRASSFSSRPIPWEDHQSWFASHLDNDNTPMYLAVDADDKPVGQIRFDIADETAEVHFGVEKSMRGRGYGTLLLQAGIDELFRRTRVQTVDAHVKPENRMSARTFEKAAFHCLGLANVRNNQALHFRWTRENSAKETYACRP